MKKLLLLFALMLLILAPAAHASDPALPADPALVQSLLPDYTPVTAFHYADRDWLYLLMTRPDGALVFVGSTKDDSGAWRLHESSPLPEGTCLGYENFVDALAIPAGDDYDLVDLRPRWMAFSFDPEDGMYGSHPWEDISAIDWANLPDSREEMLAQLDTTNRAVVRHTDCAYGLALRSEPLRSGRSPEHILPQNAGDPA